MQTELLKIAATHYFLAAFYEARASLEIVPYKK